MDNHLNTPAVHIDLDIVERNIRRAVDSLGAAGIAHRPHIKVHKSVYFAKKQIAMGCKGITCAKLGEAEVMAAGGIDDILLAFPMIGQDKLERYGALASRAGLTLRTIINSMESARGLSALGERLGRRLQVLIEIDGGINRGGIPIPGTALEKYAMAVKDLPGIEIVGVEYYGGDIYGCATADEVRLRSRREGEEVVSCGERLKALGLTPSILSAGSSFSMLYPEELKGITECRAGNYIFRDCSLLSIGLVTPEDCALRVRATVVNRQDARHAIIDAGTKTLTSDRVGAEGLGYIVEAPEVMIYKMNEEHGFLESPTEVPFAIGEAISVIPNHSCVVPNLAEEVYGMRGGALETVIPVDARGMNR